MVIAYTNASVNDFNCFALKTLASDQKSIKIIESIIMVSGNSSFLALKDQNSFVQSIAIQKHCATVVPAIYQEERQHYHALKSKKTTCTVPYSFLQFITVHYSSLQFITVHYSSLQFLTH
jgi:hypothetical protein